MAKIESGKESGKVEERWEKVGKKEKSVQKRGKLGAQATQKWGKVMEKSSTSNWRIFEPPSL